MNIRSVVRVAIMAATSFSACQPMPRPMANVPKADASSMPAWDPTKQVHYICTFNSDLSIEGILFPSGTRIKTSVSQEKIFGGSVTEVPIEQYQMENGPWKYGKKGLFQLTISAEKLLQACQAQSWKRE